jgi:hypothetical protein
MMLAKIEKYETENKRFKEKYCNVTSIVWKPRIPQFQDIIWSLQNLLFLKGDRRSCPNFQILRASSQKLQLRNR